MAQIEYVYLKDASQLDTPGNYIMFGSYLYQYLYKLHKGLVDGRIEIYVDYNRTGWDSNRLADCLVYRIEVLR